MEHKLLVLCDPEEDYAQHMAEFLRKRKDALWEVVVYTRPEELKKLNRPIDVLVIAESVYGGFVEDMSIRLIVLLNESGILREDKVLNIDKYQEAAKVHQILRSHYQAEEQDGLLLAKSEERTQIIGMYSPVKRCLQTTFALTYGQLLAQKHATLYLSFEYFAGRQEWEEGVKDGLSKLLYFLPQEKNFLAHLKSLTRTVGGLDYITPMENGENLLYVNAQDWLKLIRAIVDSGEYEYIILDLSENLQGMFELLRLCSRVYTIVKEDAAAQGKILQYEQLLQLQHCEDVKKRTSKCLLPIFRKLPDTMEQYTKGELAEYVKELLYKGGVTGGL